MSRDGKSIREVFFVVVVFFCASVGVLISMFWYGSAGAGPGSGHNALGAERRGPAAAATVSYWPLAGWLAVMVKSESLQLMRPLMDILLPPFQTECCGCLPLNSFFPFPNCLTPSALVDLLSLCFVLLLCPQCLYGFLSLLFPLTTHLHPSLPLSFSFSLARLCCFSLGMCEERVEKRYRGRGRERERER